MTKHREDLHFMKKIIILITVFSLFLGACNTDNSTEHKNDKAENPTKKDKDNKTSHKEASSKNTNTDIKAKDKVENLSEKMKLALIFCADDKGKYTLTKNNILIGSFRNDKDDYRKIGQFVLVNYPKFTNAPKGMKFYSIYPSNHEAQAIVGISDKKIILSGSQIRIKDYQQLLEHGKEYSTQKVYDKVKNNRALPELANKMHVSNQLPISNDEWKYNGLSPRELYERGGVMAHGSSQVYKFISELEGGSLDNDKYLWDVVHWLKDGNWKVNCRNKDGEIVATYTTVNGKVAKFDENGKRIK